MAGLTAFQVAMLAVAIGGTAVSVQQSRVAADKADKARKISQKQADIANQRRIRQSIERNRIAKAAVLSGGQAQTGGFGSSGIQGGVGAATSQAASNIGFAQTINAANAGINDALSQSARAQSRAGTASAIASLPGQLGFGAGDIFAQGQPAGGGFPSGTATLPKQPKPFGGFGKRTK